MQLMLKQRIFSLTDSYHVYDERGNIRYDIEDEFLSLGHQLHVYDHNTGQEIGSVHQRLLNLLPRFEIVIGGHLMGSVSKAFSLFTPRYHVDFMGWDVNGDFMGLDYRALRGGYPVLQISKAIFNWSDTYCLNISDPADEIPALMLALAIDAVNCSK